MHNRLLWEHLTVIMWDRADVHTVGRSIKCIVQLENNQNSQKGSLLQGLNTVPELVPVLNCVELRTNVFGSEQKSLRAWWCSERDVRKDERGKKQQEKGTDKAKEEGGQEKMITREALAGTLTDWHTYLPRYLTATHNTVQYWSICITWCPE